MISRQMTSRPMLGVFGPQPSRRCRARPGSVRCSGSNSGGRCRYRPQPCQHREGVTSCDVTPAKPWWLRCRAVRSSVPSRPAIA